MEPLKLAAFDTDDLAIISAHLQDAIAHVGDLAYLPERRRFALAARRFDWEAPPKEPRRRLSGLHFEGVTAGRTRGIDRARPGESVSLLAITFETTDAPSGTATLAFAGGGTVQLDLEFLEAQMSDLGPVWSADSRPSHEPGPD